jgi:isochorismate synthase EntC
VRARFDVRGSATALFQRLRAAQVTRYSALIDTGEYSLVSLSPELFFKKQRGLVQLKPMKGTAKPGRDAAEDARLPRACGKIREDARRERHDRRPAAQRHRAPGQAGQRACAGAVRGRTLSIRCCK